MSDIAIRVENLSKLYYIGRAQERHDTLRDSIADFRLRILDSFRRSNPAARDASSPQSPIRNPQAEDLWALKDVSFEACPECNRRVQRGEVVGVPSAELRAGIGRNGAGNPRNCTRAGSTLLKILSRITITQWTDGPGDNALDSKTLVFGGLTM